MDYAQQLVQVDHPTHWEYPPNFDLKAAYTRFARFVSELSAILGISITSRSGFYIQDASFHSEAFLPLSEGQQAGIRFSNFGDMVTVEDEELLPEQLLAKVLELLARQGYTYIPSSYLDTTYTGANPGVTGISTWWERYFDYV